MPIVMGIYAKERGGPVYKQENEKIRKTILNAVDGLSDAKLNQKPAESEWSPMEILEHLNLIETYIAHNLSHALASEHSEKARKKPIQLTVSRLVKVDAPRQTSPSGEFIPLEEMKARLEKSRLLLDSIYEGTPLEILENRSMKHPVFGKVPLVQWFPFIGLHEKRHLKQLKIAIEKIK